MTYRKVSSGDRVRISAKFLNDVIDRVNTPSNIPSPLKSSNAVPGVVPVKNVSGEFVDANGVLGIGDMILANTSDELPEDHILPFRGGRFVLEGKLPQTDEEDENYTDRFCILRQPLADDEVGTAWWFGICVAYVDVQDEDDQYVKLVDEEVGFLESSQIGSAEILWKEGGTGKKWAAIDLRSRIFPPLMEATTDVADSEIDGKWVSSDGTLKGTAYTFTEVPE